MRGSKKAKLGIGTAAISSLLAGMTFGGSEASVLLRGVGLSAELVALGAQLAFYSVGTYLLLPRVLPEKFASVVSVPRFGAFTTVTAVTVFVAVRLFDSGTIAVAVIGLAAVTGPMLFSLWWPTATTGGTHAAGLAQSSFSAWAHSSHAMLKRRVMVAVYFGLALTLIGKFLGILFIALDFAYPLLELGTVVGLAVGLLFPARTSTKRVERPFIEAIGAAFENKNRGFPAIFLLVAGVFASAAPMALAIIVVPHAVDISLAELSTLYGGIAVMIGICLVAYSAYGLWYWRRMSCRLPVFFQMDAGENCADPSVTRPVGGMIFLMSLPVLAAVIFLLQALVLHSTGQETVPAWIPTTALLALCSVVVTGYWSVRVTARTPPQPPSADRRAFPLAATAQTGSFVLVLSVAQAYEEIVELGLSGLSSVATDSFYILMGLIGMILSMFFAVDVTRRYADNDSWSVIFVWVGLVLVFGSIYSTL